MIESLILGAVQGIAEWLPISSEGALTLLKINLFESGLGLGELIELALFFHLGTFLAALVYFRKKVYKLFKTLFKYKEANTENRKILTFLIISSLISGILGYLALAGIKGLDSKLELAGEGATLLVGILLLITGLLQFAGRTAGQTRTPKDLKLSDGVFLGVVQSLAILPGFSRSGFTISALLLTKFKEADALTLSFLMSLPAALGANILLNTEKILSFSLNSLLGLIASFIFGLLTIHFLIKAAKKMNFGWFVILFGLLTILFSLV